MDGYVIILEHDEGNEPDTYWSGSSTTSSLDQTVFFNDIVAARQAAGTIQTQYTDRSVRIAKATRGTQLVTESTISNVAASL